MSKFLDKMDKISRGGSSSMGFGFGTRVEKVPAMALVGLVKGSPDHAAMLVDLGADAVLVEGESSSGDLNKVAEKLNGVPWGLRVAELEAEQAASFREAGCDFIAFGPEKARLAAMEGEDTAYLLCIQPDMEERSLRAIEDLPVDGVLLPASVVGLPLTIEHLINLGAIRVMFGKYLFLELPGAVSSRELEGLRDLGVDGVVVDPSVISKDDIQRLISDLKDLPKRQRERSRKADALLPRSSLGFVGAPSREDDDDDDDE